MDGGYVLRDQSLQSCPTVTVWTVARQASLSGDSPGMNTGVGCHALPPPGDILNPGLNPHLLCLLHWQEFFTC